MKKMQFKLFPLTNVSDLEVDLNALGEYGWRPNQALMTPFGPKFVLERQTDEEVSSDDAQKHQMDELYRKFSL